MPNGPANTALTVTIDERGRLARLDVPTLVARGRPQRSRRRRRAAADGAQPDRRRRHDSGQRLQPRRHAHDAAGASAGSGIRRSCSSPVQAPVDRDSTVAGIPVLSQLAGALAEQGFLVLRYDKRGVGQSGGRTESATQRDYADDLIGVVKWLERRDDVDPRRIAVAGHSEGGAIALLAAAREKKIDAVVLIAATGTTGADLILEQQRHVLDRMKLDAGRAGKRASTCRRRSRPRSVSGTGWEGVPPELRQQADTPWFKSVLTFDPAAIVPRVEAAAPDLQGDLDAQVPPHHADKLAELAQHAQERRRPVEVVHLPGINHLLVPAKTGAVQEYGQLESKTITPEVASTIAAWLKKQP